MSYVSIIDYYLPNRYTHNMETMYMPIIRFKKGDLDVFSKIGDVDNVLPLLSVDNEFRESYIELLPNRFFYDPIDKDTLDKFKKLVGEKGKNGIPVYHNLNELTNNCCFRLVVNSFSPENSSKNHSDFGNNYLLIDFGDISDSNFFVLEGFLQSMEVQSIMNLGWKGIFVSATCVPRSMSEISSGEEFIERKEWDFFTNLISKYNSYNIHYSDYGTQHPYASVSDFNPKFMTPSAKIRYTLEKKIVIHKGKSVRKHGFDQFSTLSKKLVNSQYYKGKEYSYGDDYIWGCSQAKYTGSLTTWITAELAHHITLITNQLSNLPAS